MKHCMLILLLLGNVAFCSEKLIATKHITFDAILFKDEEVKAKVTGEQNPYIFQDINDKLHFSFIFTSKDSLPDGLIKIIATDLTKMKDYENNQKKLNQYTNYPITLKSGNTLLFFFKEKFLESQFEKFQCCLSYAFSQGKSVQIDPTFINNFVDIESEISNQKELKLDALKIGYENDINALKRIGAKGKEFEKMVEDLFYLRSTNIRIPLTDFSQKIALKSTGDDPTIIIYIPLSLDNTQEHLFSAMQFFAEKKQRRMIQSRIKFDKENNRLDEIVVFANELYKQYLKRISDSKKPFDENTKEINRITGRIRFLEKQMPSYLESLGNLTLDVANFAAPFALSKEKADLFQKSIPFIKKFSYYGFGLLRLYSSYQLVKRIGSLRSLPQLPKTTSDITKAAFYAYAPYSLWSDIVKHPLYYDYVRPGIVWIKEKMYGKPNGNVAK